MLLVFGVPVRNSRIKIPAVIVETWLPPQGLNLRARFLLDLGKADAPISHLHAGIVDVVLDINFPAGRAQKPDEGIAENRIAQMSDVRGLIGIDARVLAPNLAGGGLGGGGCRNG